MSRLGTKTSPPHTPITEQTLLASQSEKIEEMLWISLRMFEERSNLLTSMERMTTNRSRKSANRQQLLETQGHTSQERRRKSSGAFMCNQQVLHMTSST